MRQKNLYLLTFGCQMNVYDSERISQLLSARNYRLVEEPAEADLIFLNTCSVRKKAEQKTYSALGRFRGLKKRNPELIIGIGGCVAQQEGEKLLQRAPYLDFVLGTKELPRINQLLDDLEAFGKRGVATTLDSEVNPYTSLPLCPSPAKATAFVSIMQGCDNFCSYCVVPFVRGREVSRPSVEILKEIQVLSSRGVKEVTLLGQNVNSYGKKTQGELTFVQLLRAIQGVAGIERIRFTTSHPKDLSPDLVAAFGKLSKLCEHIHLPFQSGSNRILERMNRGYRREEYLRKVQDLRRTCPEISITADIIVGVPGEEEEDFQATLEMMERVQFDDLFSFKYSDRPNTRASQFSDKIPEAVSRRRLMELQALQRRITFMRNKAWEGREVEVLVEGRSKANSKELMGRTRSNRIVNFPGDPSWTGSLMRVRVQEAFAHSLRGEAL